MSVRNIDAINRKAEQVAQEKANAKELAHKQVDDLINAILASYNDVKDVVDTISALYAKGLGQLYGKFEQGNLNTIKYNSQYEALEMWCNRCVIRIQTKDSTSSPIKVGWSDCGMCESYDLFSGMSDYTYNCVLDRSRRGYLYLLQEMAAALQPFCNAFFQFVETL